MQPLWISRHFDSVYSVAITEKAVYIGGHFSCIESPTADDPWPGLDNVGYGTGQGLSGYGLGDQVVRRDHIARHRPRRPARRWSGTPAGRTPSRATRPWRPPHAGSSSAATADPGRRPHRPRRVLRLQHRPVPAHRHRHHDHHPDRGSGRRRRTRRSTITGTARAASGTSAGPGRDPGPRQRPVPAGQPRPPGAAANTHQRHARCRYRHDPHLVAPGHHHRRTATCRSWPRRSPRTAARRRHQGASRRSRRSASTTRPRRRRSPARAASRPSTTFTMTGTATDDHGVNSLTLLVP